MYKECKTHGSTIHRPRTGGGWRCAECAKDAVNKRRRKLKAILVEEAGGACKICGYNTYVGSLEFHHVDPTTKLFGISSRGLTRSLEAAREEAAKCVLLCRNCHGEVEGGVTFLSGR
jgi:hypothetical protein